MTSINEERSKLEAVGMRHRRRWQWGAKYPYTDARTVVEPATRVFIHISVTNPESYKSFDAHARAIEAIGISRFPSTGISYNRLIMAGSTDIWEAQPVGRRGAHTVNNYQISTCTRFGSQCPGYGTSITAPSWNLNYNTRAYVYCANINHSVPDHVVDNFARAIAADYHAGFITRSAAHNFHGHRCVSSKSCPGNKLWARMDDIHTAVHRYIDNGLGEVENLSWSEDLTPGTPGDDITNLAHNTLPDSWGRSAADLLGYAASAFAWLRETDGITKKAWVVDHVLKAPSRYPHSDTNPHWTAHRFLSEIWDMLDVLQQVPDRIAALEDTVLGSSADEIRTLIEQRYAAAATERAELNEKLDATINALAGVKSAVDNYQEGVIDEATLIDELLRRLAQLAPAPAPTDAEGN